ncbi:P-loop containing nucleoside triphosphate hydrolase protein [Fimicolochytrium jonesii]|uniref:P-loop containing nucleoside triphosphate hydrolase protein n=1 Tax=Fimicolochytrium jonesii TaxID=1396493 RepID=UPI0022FE19CF|nr:P-loop containing nucleoside triphosphate hydrolase protein [Fimicolochytrium jonesii]KAI8818302.1 P-loop containing nucleoside triphosphate hydrolase protein [Fimicolochytrium jonesii]
MTSSHKPSTDGVCIEEVQTVFPARNTTDEMYLAFTSSLQRIRDADNGVLLLATCSDSSSLHPEVLKRFEENIPLELPTLPHRLALLHYLTSSSHPTPLNLHPIAERSQAFRLADLAELCDSALRHAFSRQGDGYGSSVTLVQEDFDAAFGAVEIKASEGGRYEGAKVEVVRWADVGGHAKAKTLLKESVVWSFKNIDAFKRLGIAPSKGVLLHGPPGTGKTLLAKAVATESGANFMPISIPELIKGEVGESEKAITRTFTLARRTSPTIIFIDELEALFSRHENMGDAGKKLFSMLVVEIDALEAGSGVVLLCATNYPGLVEKALLRPGRIDRLISIPPPTHRDRLSILQTLTKRLTLAPDVDLAVLARRMKGATGADLKEVVRRASLAAIAREGFQNKPVVQMADFQAKEVRAYGGGGVAS